MDIVGLKEQKYGSDRPNVLSSQCIVLEQLLEAKVVYMRESGKKKVLN